MVGRFRWMIFKTCFPGDRPLVLKIDVEGHECLTLKGGMKYLQKFRRIVQVVMEVTPDTVRTCPIRRELFDLLGRHHGLVPVRWNDRGVVKPTPTQLSIDNMTGWYEGKDMYNVIWSLA
jgi:hypothetical protein